MSTIKLDLQALLDRAAIHDAQTRYFQGIDRGSPEQVRRLNTVDQDRKVRCLWGRAHHARGNTFLADHWEADAIPVGAALAAKRLVQAISILVTQQGVGQRMHGKERQQRNANHCRNEESRHHVGEALDGRARALCFGHHLHDL